MYRVRKYGTTVKIALNSNTTSYIDTDISMGTPNDVYVSYWITARINSTTESLSGNTVKTKGEFLPQKISTNNENEKELPRFRLSANYPNPFNPSTTISYQIPQKGNVTLTIYNTSGEEISTLVNETKGDVKKIILWTISTEGQKIIGASGFVPIWLIAI